MGQEELRLGFNTASQRRIQNISYGVGGKMLHACKARTKPLIRDAVYTTADFVHSNSMEVGDNRQGKLSKSESLIAINKKEKPPNSI